MNNIKSYSLKKKKKICKHEIKIRTAQKSPASSDCENLFVAKMLMNSSSLPPSKRKRGPRKIVCVCVCVCVHMYVCVLCTHNRPLPHPLRYLLMLLCVASE